MAITYIDSALGGTTTTTSFSITLPTTAAGDILILDYVSRALGDTTVGGTTGLTWTRAHSQGFSDTGAGDSFNAAGKTFWARATGDHSGQTVTGTGTLNNTCAAVVTIYRGALASGDPLADATIVGAKNVSGDETQSQLTTTTDGAWVVLVVANTPDLAVTSPACTSPGALSIRAERLSTGGSDSSIMHASAEKATAGATGAFTWVQTDALSGSWAYAITPEPTGSTFSGSGTATLPLATASGAGTKERKGSGTPSLPKPTASGTASRALKGSGAPTLTLITGSGTGKKERAGTGSASLPLQTASGVGKRDLKSTGAPTLTLVTSSGSGSSAPPGTVEHSGSGSSTLPTLTGDGAGTKERKGTGTPTLTLLTGSGTGSRALKATGATNLPLLTVEGTGGAPAVHEGEGAATLPTLAASGAGPRRTEEQPSGGYGWANLAEIERRRRKREEEELADALEVAMAAEGLVEPDPVVAARHVVREYVKTNGPATRRMQRAVEHAYRAQSDLAWQLAAREIARQEEDDFAVLLAIATLH
jgi:hypothetical protein